MEIFFGVDWINLRDNLRYIQDTHLNYENEIIQFMDIVIVSAVSLTVNIFLGKYRTKFRKMTFMWWLMIHASIPLIIPLRIWLDTPKVAIPLFIGLAVIGQLIGSKVIVLKKQKKSDL